METPQEEAEEKTRKHGESRSRLPQGHQAVHAGTKNSTSLKLAKMKSLIRSAGEITQTHSASGISSEIGSPEKPMRCHGISATHLLSECTSLLSFAVHALPSQALRLYPRQPVTAPLI